jgi:predicted DCC family thiol-disulfide oxidoreductase YuxK
VSAALIYDANCPICCAARDWVERNAVDGAFEFLPCQSDERAQRFPEIATGQCMEAMQLVRADGRRYAGDAALPEICLGLRRWRWVAKILRLPLIAAVSPTVYRFIARRRHMFSVLVARKPPASCPAESAK